MWSIYPFVQNSNFLERRQSDKWAKITCDSKMCQYELPALEKSIYSTANKRSERKVLRLFLLGMLPMQSVERHNFVPKCATETALFIIANQINFTQNQQVEVVFPRIFVVAVFFGTVLFNGCRPSVVIGNVKTDVLRIGMAIGTGHRVTFKIMITLFLRIQTANQAGTPSSVYLRR